MKLEEFTLNYNKNLTMSSLEFDDIKTNSDQLIYENYEFSDGSIPKLNHDHHNHSYRNSVKVLSIRENLHVYFRMFLEQILIALITYGILRCILFFYNRRLKIEAFKSTQMPGPPIKSIIFGNMWDFRRNGMAITKKWHEKYGKIFGFMIGEVPHIRISDPEIAKEIFVKQTKLFNARLYPQASFNRIDRSIFFNHGELWRLSRRLLKPAFSNQQLSSAESDAEIEKGLKKFVTLVDSMISKNNEKIQQQSSQTNCLDQKDSIVLNVYDYMQVIVLDVIVRTAFDMDVVDVSKGDKDETLLLLNNLMNNNDASVTHFIYAIPFIKYILNPLVTHILPTGRKFDAFLHQTVEQKIKKQIANRSRTINQAEDKKTLFEHQNGTTNNFENNSYGNQKLIDLLVTKYIEGEITLDLIYANALAILIAGYDTTSISSTYTLWALAKHQDIQEKLRDDIKQHGSESEYLEMVIKESLRLYPVTSNFLMRSPNQDTIVGDKYKLLKHSIVTYNYTDAHHDENYWPDPLRFDPERFAKGKAYDKMAFVPFGAGLRICIGYRLAIKEIKYILTYILNNFRLELVEPFELERTVKSYFNSQPSTPVKIRFSTLKKNV